MPLEGKLQEFEMSDILQLVSAGRRTGIMTIHNERDQTETFLYCVDGQIVHATCGDRQGEEIVLELLSAGEGQFSFEPVEVKCPASIASTTENLILEGMRRVDERAARRADGDIAPHSSAEELLRTMMEMGATDVHLNVGVPPHVRVDGKLIPFEAPAITPLAVEKLALSVLSQSEAARLRTDGDVETSYGYPGVGRFRISVYKQRGSISLVARAIPYEHIPLDRLGLPDSVLQAIERPAGLVLVTGSTGCGKSTTLASIIEHINATRACNIITLEDPIEFVYPQKKSIIRQRQVGQDTESFAAGLKHVLRQDPDVILVGEMRDLETMEGALFAAETGQLVFATLHTTDAAGTINRIIDVFPSRQQEQIRTVLSMVLQAVICQQLVPRAKGQGRVLAAEVMVASAAIRAMVREGKVHQLSGIIELGGKDGMRSMNQALADLARRGLITPRAALAHSHDPDTLRVQLQGVTAAPDEPPAPPPKAAADQRADDKQRAATIFPGPPPGREGPDVTSKRPDDEVIVGVK